MRLMGIAVWLIAGIGAYFLARLMPVPHGRRWPDLLLSIAAALAAGLTATALDFGGWSEPDYRAALFALFLSLLALATKKLVSGLEN
jgi:hypothetical protein